MHAYFHFIQTYLYVLFSYVRKKWKPILVTKTLGFGKIGRFYADTPERKSSVPNFSWHIVSEPHCQPTHCAYKGVVG